MFAAEHVSWNLLQSLTNPASVESTLMEECKDSKFSVTYIGEQNICFGGEFIILWDGITLNGH